MHRRLKLFFSITVSIFFIYISLGKIDHENLTNLLINANPIYLFLVFILEFILIEVSAHRWNFILKSFGVFLNTKLVFRIFYKSLFFGSFMPGTLGIDSAKVYFMKKNKVSVSKSLLSIIVDKIFTLYGLLVVSTISFFFLKNDTLSSELSYIFGFIFPVTTAVGFVFFASLKFFSNRNINLSFIKYINSFTSGLKTNFFSSSIFFSILGAFNYSFQFYLAYKAFGFGGNFFIFSLFVPVIIILQSLPISFLGFGLREYSAIYLFGLFGAQADISFMASCAFLFVSLLCILFGYFRSVF